MAKVYLASATGPGGFNKLVVLKSMRESDLEDDAIREMFVEEARLSARFNHPNLVQVQEVSLHTDPPFLVMEYLEGKPLSGLRAASQITLGMRLALLSEVLTGLEYAHTLCDFDGAPLSIVHRDVSPHNVFVTYDGSVKVLDFGIAKMVTSRMRTEAGEVKGKLAYMAPEQMLGSALDRRADLFSVGSMLWEAAIGKRMWDGVTEPQLMHRLAVGDVPRPSEHGQLDPELEAIIVKATAPDPNQRYESALALQRELDAYRARMGEHSSLRDIGVLLADSFQTERRRNAELVSVALQQSLPPPPASAEEIGLEELPPASRGRWLLPAALLVLALGGVVASQLLRSKAELPASLPSATASVRGSALAAPPVAVPSSVSPSTEATATTDPSSDSEADSAPSASSKSARKAAHGARPVAAPPIAPPPAAPPPAAAPAANEGCSPPFYFVHGIKTYKPECL